MALIYSIKNLNWLILVAIERNFYWKVLKKKSIQRGKMDWYLVFNISISVFDVSVCCDTFCDILTYSPFQNSIVFAFGLYNMFQQKLQGDL